ncbi:MAG: hypothetical protein M3N95_00315 [Actinomycetota bacterium]|nr:hypothetical protein [Actinomycetota bacterium]
MPRHDNELFTAPAVAPDAPHVIASPPVSAVIEQLRRDRGPQVIVLAPSRAALRLALVRQGRGFVPNEHEVLVGTVAHCPVYADSRHTALYPNEALVVVLGRPCGVDDAPVFLARPESSAEWQQRVLGPRIRGTQAVARSATMLLQRRGGCRSGERDAHLGIDDDQALATAAQDRVHIEVGQLGGRSPASAASWITGRTTTLRSTTGWRPPVAVPQ